MVSTIDVFPGYDHWWRSGRLLVTWRTELVYLALMKLSIGPQVVNGRNAIISEKRVDHPGSGICAGFTAWATAYHRNI